MEELTTTRPAKWGDGEPGYAVVRPDQDELYECPFIFMSDVGTLGFDEGEVDHLRDYLLKGGFIWVDDFWGSNAWDQWESQIRRVFPDHSIVDIRPDHTLMHTLYSIEEIPQIPSI